MGALAAARDDARVRVRALSTRADETAVIGARRDAALRRGADDAHVVGVAAASAAVSLAEALDESARLLGLSSAAEEVLWMRNLFHAGPARELSFQ